MKVKFTAPAPAYAFWHEDNTLAACRLFGIPVRHLVLVQMKGEIQPAVLTADGNH